MAPEQLVKPELEHISSWDFAREIQPGVYVHDDYDLERPSVELKTQQGRCRAAYAPSDYEIYDYPGHYLQKADGEQYADVRIDEFGTPVRDRAGRRRNAQGHDRRRRCSRSTTYPREDQNLEHLILAASYDLEFSDYEAMPDGRRHQLSRAASSRCRASSSSGRGGRRPSRSCRGRRPRVVVGPAATRSTPTSTAG